ncbi:MAG: phage regulatory CII family protein [Solidesulfovibrio sp. DCME]|uniref:phage regulatory CII family protein n=1 Tax=Solidesulfovibrio sp. DCME TaxID=3447380 RepID=UPI003D135FB0
MQKGIQDLILRMVHNSLRPIKSIAEEVGKPYSTLMRELDPEDRGAKLGVEMLLPLMRACDSTLPLRFLAEGMGHRVVSVRDIEPDKPTFHEELLDTYQALTAYHRAMLEGRSVEEVAKRREVLIRQLKEDFAFYTTRKEQEKA